jgi:hypothetical protein
VAFVWTLIAQPMEQNPYAQKYEKSWEVYWGTGCEEINLRFLHIASDDQCQCDIPAVMKY